jgi:hypothetical protein
MSYKKQELLTLRDHLGSSSVTVGVRGFIQIVDRVLLSIFVIVTLTVTVVVMVQGPAMYGTPINIDIHD